MVPKRASETAAATEPPPMPAQHSDRCHPVNIGDMCRCRLRAVRAADRNPRLGSDKSPVELRILSTTDELVRARKTGTAPRRAGAGDTSATSSSRRSMDVSPTKTVPCFPQGLRTNPKVRSLVGSRTRTLRLARNMVLPDDGGPLPRSEQADYHLDCDFSLQGPFILGSSRLFPPVANLT